MSFRDAIEYPDYKLMLQGCAGYIEYEKRDAMYKLALKLIKDANWNAEKLTEALGVLLLSWNAAFYTKYGSFDFDILEQFIIDNKSLLKHFERRYIFSYTTEDNNTIQNLYSSLLEATKSVRKIGRTPVGVSKTLHLLAPNFFSLWDTAIAKKYKVYWYNGSKLSYNKYIKNQKITYDICENVVSSYLDDYQLQRNEAITNICSKLYPKMALSIYSKKMPIKKSLVKMIDEFNFAKYRLGLNLDKYKELIEKIINSLQD